MLFTSMNIRCVTLMFDNVCFNQDFKEQSNDKLACTVYSITCNNEIKCALFLTVFLINAIFKPVQ